MRGQRQFYVPSVRLTLARVVVRAFCCWATHFRSPRCTAKTCRRCRHLAATLPSSRRRFHLCHIDDPSSTFSPLSLWPPIFGNRGDLDPIHPDDREFSSAHPGGKSRFRRATLLRGLTFPAMPRPCPELHLGKWTAGRCARKSFGNLTSIPGEIGSRVTRILDGPYTSGPIPIASVRSAIDRRQWAHSGARRLSTMGRPGLMSTIEPGLPPRTHRR